ncbi:MAG: AAA family ATPase, partial [bacterium]
MSNTEKEQTYTVSKILKIFGTEVSNTSFAKAAAKGNIPAPERTGGGAVTRREWKLEDIPSIGERYGFLNSHISPTSMAIFTTKGGVLKTTLALNIARMAALHNVKTCVVGLDVQGDVSATLGHQLDLDSCNSLKEAVQEIIKVKGLSHLIE